MMHDIWNPWHGCLKYSEGCKNCYMYYLDKIRGNSGAYIYKVKANFYYPLAKNRQGEYKIKSGEQIRVCMTSDFFLKEADEWREEAWRIIKARSDVIFILITKRAERIRACLPKNWGDGWENVFLHVTCENQKRADERIPILLSLPFKHKGIIVAPFLENVSIEKYLKDGEIEHDHIIDLGPEGGSAGGLIIAEGTPEQVAEVPGSFTGQYLKPLLEKDAKLRAEGK